MPFEPHPDLPTPPDDTVIWRYLDFPKFVDLVERRKLWFSRADRFEDPLEGTFTDAEVAHYRSLAPSGTEWVPQIPQLMRRSIFVNCWREGRHESTAMWDIYGKGGAVVAIKSTIGLLKGAVAAYRWNVFMSRVKYIDWGLASWDVNALAMCTRKDLSYSHESEVRAIIWGLATMGSPASSLFSSLNIVSEGDETRVPIGEEVDIDPAHVITEVVVGPREQAMIHNLVQAIMKRYGLSQPVRASDRLKSRS